jgi:hypothetical protein
MESYQFQFSKQAQKDIMELTSRQKINGFCEGDRGLEFGRILMQ